MLGKLWQYYKNEPTLTDAGTLDNFPLNSVSFKFTQKNNRFRGHDGTENVETRVPLKYLSDF